VEEALMLYERSRALLGPTSLPIAVALRHVSSLAALGRFSAAEAALAQLSRPDQRVSEPQEIIELLHFSAELWLYTRQFHRCANSNARVWHGATENGA
jgi:hypothetical protein